MSSNENEGMCQVPGTTITGTAMKDFTGATTQSDQASRQPSQCGAGSVQKPVLNVATLIR